MRSDRTALRRWIIPTIGRTRLSDLTPGHVRLVLDKQRAAGRGSSTLRRTHSTLMQLLKAARAEGHNIPLRVLEVPAPAAAASTRGALSTTSAVAILRAAAQATPGPYAHHPSRWVAAMVQGLRQGEALGMTRDCIDLARGQITVAWQMQPLPYRVRYDRDSGIVTPDGYESIQLEGRLHLVRPKTKAGLRVLPLLPVMVASLEAWMDDIPDNPHGLIWPTHQGRPMTSTEDDRAWYALQDAAGIDKKPDGKPWTIHEIRHTTATLLMELGVDPKTIVAIMGHASITTTHGYQHVSTTQALSALTRVADALQLTDATAQLGAAHAADATDAP